MISCYKGLLLLLLILFCTNKVFAQSTYSEYVVGTYNTDYFTDSSGELKQHLVKRFSLPQSIADTYQIEIFEDSLSTLSIGRNNKYDRLYTIRTETPVEPLPNNTLPEFTIKDFNNDGYYDLSCWVYTNVNGNEWTELFLYNSATKRLEILQNTAEGRVIWDAPVYHKDDRTITCTLEASAYGYSFKSKYKLKNNKAKPISKEADNTTQMNEKGNGEVYEKYIGYKQHWKLVKRTVVNRQE